VSSRARATASVRLAAPSLPRTWLTCFLTVSRSDHELLDRLYAAAAAQDRTGSLVETGALRALALTASGDDAGAVTTLAGGACAPPPQGYVRAFADEGPRRWPRCSARFVAAQRTGRAAAEVPVGYLARLQRAFGPGQPAHDPVPAGIVDPLTSRELEVLETLAADRSNQAIAGEPAGRLRTPRRCDV